MLTFQTCANEDVQPFLKNSNFATFAALFVNFFTMFLPISLLTTLIAKFMDFPTDAAQTTAAFVKSPHGIHEALHMARDEMFQIDTDIWDEEVWGAAASEPASYLRAQIIGLQTRQEMRSFIAVEGLAAAMA
jgi:hypothetical protein